MVKVMVTRKKINQTNPKVSIFGLEMVLAVLEGIRRVNSSDWSPVIETDSNSKGSSHNAGAAKGAETPKK